MAATTHALMFGHSMAIAGESSFSMDSTSSRPLHESVMQFPDGTILHDAGLRGLPYYITDSNRRNPSNCRNCGASQTKNGQCAYCGSER